MRITAWLVCLSIGVSALAQTVPAAAEKEDVICRMLWNEYVLHASMINGDEMEAAFRIIAARGLGTGFWRVVLEDFKNPQAPIENQHRIARDAGRILEQMLRRDGDARFVLNMPKEQQEGRQQIPAVCLGDDVLDEVMAKARDGDRFGGFEAVRAIAGSLDPRTAPYLLRVIEKDDPLEGTRFFAAVGLAEMGQPEGIQRLIENVDAKSGYIDWTTIIGAKNSSIAEMCKTALQQITGQKLKKKADWQAWWKDHAKDWKPVDRVRFGRWEDQ